MTIAIIPEPTTIRMEIDVSQALLKALQKLPVDGALTSEERFEIACLIFLTARALRQQTRPG